MARDENAAMSEVATKTRVSKGGRTRLARSGRPRRATRAGRARATEPNPRLHDRPAGRASGATQESAFVDTYLAALLARASLLISGEFHRVVRAHGLSVPEWRILASLSDGSAVSTGRLAQLVLAKQPALSRQLDRMQQRGQVERFVDARDRRYTWVRITPTGRRIVARLIDLARAHERQVLRPFGLDWAERLKSTLRRIIELHEAPAGP